MEEIKFRAWDVKNHRMFQVSNMSFRPSGDVFKVWEESVPITEGLLINPDYGFLREYIGLKDKNEVEIYKGDIVHYKYDYGGQDNWEVAWGDDCWILVRGDRTTGDCNCSDDPHYNDWKGTAVIGNIHENPELLGTPQSGA